MMKLLTIAFLFVTFFNIDSILRAQVVDDGFSSDYHKLHAGTIVFSNENVPIGKEDPTHFKNEFNWGETIYTRNYLKRGIGREYEQSGWEITARTSYTLEIHANEAMIASYSVIIDPKWTTFQSCLQQSDKDDLTWGESAALWYNLDKMKYGKNKITIKVFASKGETKGNLVCEGSIFLNVNKEAIEKAKIPLFTGFITKWSGNEAWTEWVINFNRYQSSMKTKWSGSDGWKEWGFSIPGFNGGIKTKWSGDDAWKEWTYSYSGGSIEIKTRWSGDDAIYEWVISSPDGTLNVKTRWSGNDRWKEWIITGVKGSIEVKTRWSGDNAWADWMIYDNMPDEDINLKMAAIFPCVLTGAVLK